MFKYKSIKLDSNCYTDNKIFNSSIFSCVRVCGAKKYFIGL